MQYYYITLKCDKFLFRNQQSFIFYWHTLDNLKTVQCLKQIVNKFYYSCQTISNNRTRLSVCVSVIVTRLRRTGLMRTSLGQTGQEHMGLGHTSHNRTPIVPCSYNKNHHPLQILDLNNI